MNKACKEFFATNELLLRKNWGFKKGLKQWEMRKKWLLELKEMFISPNNHKKVFDWFRERHKEEKCLNLH